MAIGTGRVETLSDVLDTIHRIPTRGIPTAWMNVMEHAALERLAGAAPGSYRENPTEVYLACQKAMGVSMLDQWIPTNPLSMEHDGFHGGASGATTGKQVVELDGIRIDSPEAVVEHMETVDFPQMRSAIDGFDESCRVARIVAEERRVQAILGDDILKTGYGYISFPQMQYYRYGYEHFFTALLMYPDVMATSFSLQADWCLLNNRAAVRAVGEASLPVLFRADHDMADSRGLMVDMSLLDTLWFPHFARCLEPAVSAGIQLLWHCDGNLMAMVPRLIDIGFEGFQGFQYEDGMDYRQICSLKTRTGNTPIIMAGVSVSTVLPHGSPADVRDQLRWLVENGPETGLFLGASSSIAPGVSEANMDMLIDGLRYYREKGKSGL